MVNKVVQAFSQKHFYPLKVFKVKSRTNFNPDIGQFEEYSVELWSEDKWYCNCMGFRTHKKPCKHIKLIQQELANNK